MRLLIRPKKVVLFPEIGRVKSFLLLTHLHSRICIRTYIFNFKKLFLISKNRQAKKQEYKKVKETKEEKRISPEN